MVVIVIVTLPRLPPTHLEDSFVAGLAGWLAEVKQNQSYFTCLEGSGRLDVSYSTCLEAQNVDKFITFA